jgi:KUP system potassium uptake protein
MQVIFTQAEESGQVYLPLVNWLLMAACVALVVGFGSSDALASAYGVAVSMDMVVTTLLAVAVA